MSEECRLRGNFWIHHCTWCLAVLHK